MSAKREADLIREFMDLRAKYEKEIREAWDKVQRELDANKRRASNITLVKGESK